MASIATSFGSLPSPLSSRLSALSSTHSLTPSQLYECWEAYSLTRDLTALDDATMSGFETHVRSMHKTKTVVINSALGKRSVMGVTPSPAPKLVRRSGLSAVDTLTQTPTKDAQGGTVATPGSAKSLTSVATVTPQKAALYSARTGRNTTVASYNPHNLSELKADELTKDVVSIQPHPSCPSISERNGFAPLVTRAKSLEDRWHRMNDALIEKYDLKTEEDDMVAVCDGMEVEDRAYWTPVGVPGQRGVVCVGRVCNEAHSGRINSTSLLLEGSRQYSSGSRITLDLPKDLSYSFFPGQIVALEGMNSSGRIMRPVKVMEGAAPPKPTVVKSEVAKEPVKIVTMAGPYTTSDNLEYAPLIDAVLKLSEEKPSVVILCGPFVDSRQALVQECIIEEDGVEKKVSHEYLFRIRIAELFSEMYENYELNTQIVLVPSTEDAFLDSVYPQPPIASVESEMLEFGGLGLNDSNLKKNVHCVSNPATLKINELVIGVTSSDVLFHINCDSTSVNLPPTGRLSRIAQHLIHQRSYYPLFPAAKGACLDLSQQECWEMPVQPDILIVPSKLNPFVKEVMDSVVVNPGALTKNTTGGTFAVMDIYPMKDVESLGEDEEIVDIGVKDRVRVDIKRI